MPPVRRSAAWALTGAAVLGGGAAAVAAPPIFREVIVDVTADGRPDRIVIGWHDGVFGPGSADVSVHGPKGERLWVSRRHRTAAVTPEGDIRFEDQDLLGVTRHEAHWDGTGFREARVGYSPYFGRILFLVAFLPLAFIVVPLALGRAVYRRVPATSRVAAALAGVAAGFIAFAGAGIGFLVLLIEWDG